MVAGELEWLSILKGRRIAAEQSDDQSAASYIVAQMLMVENEAQSVAESFNIEPVSSTAVEPVLEDTSIAKTHQATYPTITALSLDAFPRSPLNTASAEEGRAIPGGNGSSDTEEEDGEAGSSASDTDSD